jgi:hypothetical protein
MAFDWFFRDKRTGKLALIQLPNPALWVFTVATLLRWSPYDAHDTKLGWIATGALIAWALDELVRGHAPVRRLLGAIVLAYELWRIS